MASVSVNDKNILCFAIQSVNDLKFDKLESIKKHPWLYIRLICKTKVLKTSKALKLLATCQNHQHFT
jgi:hypothetical protein